MFEAPADLPEDPATLQAILRAALAEIERLQFQLAGLQRNRFGRRSEKLADETVQFSLDGVSYEIDLSTKNATRLRDALSRYVMAGRRVGTRSGRRRGRGRSGAGDGSAREVREWARANGHKVSDRGRVPSEVVEAYRAAH